MRAEWLQQQLAVTCRRYCVNIDSTQYFVNYIATCIYCSWQKLLDGQMRFLIGHFSLSVCSWQKLLVRQLPDLSDPFHRPCNWMNSWRWTAYEVPRLSSCTNSSIYNDTILSRSTVVLLGLGQDQNGCLYTRYRSSSMKNKADERKSLRSISPCYSIAKCTL